MLGTLYGVNVLNWLLLPRCHNIFSQRVKVEMGRGVKTGSPSFLISSSVMGFLPYICISSKHSWHFFASLEFHLKIVPLLLLSHFSWWNHVGKKKLWPHVVKAPPSYSSSTFLYSSHFTAWCVRKLQGRKNGKKVVGKLSSSFFCPVWGVWDP